MFFSHSHLSFIYIYIYHGKSADNPYPDHIITKKPHRIVPVVANLAYKRNKCKQSNELLLTTEGQQFIELNTSLIQRIVRIKSI